MKMMKRVFSLLLALAVVSALGVSALAAGEGTITINGTTQDRVYDAYKIFDLTYAGTGGNVTAAYTIDPDWETFFGSSGAGAEYISNTNIGDALNPVIINGTTKYINIIGDNVAKFAQKALAEAARNHAHDKSITASGTSAEFTGLDLGYYLVYPQGATDVDTAGGYASLCSLTSTIPTGTVNVKATYPKIKKEVNDTAVDIGQTVTYTITGKVPDTTGYTAYTYVVKDTMDEGLTFNESVADFSVTINGTEITTTPQYKDNGFTLTLDMTGYQETLGHQNLIGTPVIITYSAVVNAKAVIGKDGNQNSATLTYSNDPTNSMNTVETPPEVRSVYTAAIEINKVDGANNAKKLEGAEFILQDSDNKYYKFTAANTTTPETVEWLSTATGATVMTTDIDGKAYFKGLESGTYKLIEKKAPDGYNLLTTPASITINDQNQEATTYQISTIENNTGSVLPSTGGIGTTIFYIVGGVLVAGAIVLLITKKRMSMNEG